MASHWSFGHLQPKLRAKEGSGVKLAVWLPTTKSRDSTCSWCALGECNAALKSSQRGLQVWFRPCPNRRLRREAMMSQSLGSPKLGQFRDSTLGALGKSAIRMQVRQRSTENTIGRMVVAPPEFGPWCVIWVRVSPWLVPTPNACRMSSNQLMLVLDASSWPNSLIFSYSNPGTSSTPLYPFLVLEVGSSSLVPTFRNPTHLDPQVGPTKNLGVRHHLYSQIPFVLWWEV
jgi:hypothetical protein